MRLALDGLPHDLPLSPTERRRLYTAIRDWKPPTGRRPYLASLIPAAVMALTLCPIILVGYAAPTHLLWTAASIPPMLALQLWLTRRLMSAALWPYTCRAMAANGYEVCPRCAYPLKDADPHILECPECGAQRLPPSL
jgi:hypothetical protein